MMAWPPEFPDEEDWSVSEQLINKLLGKLHDLGYGDDDEIILAGLEKLIEEE